MGFLRLCIGNLIGMAVVTPIILRLHAPGFSRLRAVDGFRVLEIAALCGALLVLAWYIFGIKETDEFKLFDLLFLPMVALAVRYGLDGALAGLAPFFKSPIGVAEQDFSRQCAMLESWIASIARDR